jgi:hypothetical protein
MGSKVKSWCVSGSFGRTRHKCLPNIKPTNWSNLPPVSLCQTLEATDNENNNSEQTWGIEPTPTRSGRQVCSTERLQMSSVLPKLQSFVSTTNYPSPVLANAASIADPDTMYLHEALKQPDKEKFLEAMVKEIDNHTSRGHWRLTTEREMREQGYIYKPIAAIWSFKHKRNPFGEIIKYKARLCCHGGQTVKGVHYEETFSPVVATV